MSNNKIEFIDTSKEVKNTMVKLSKSALRASAKVAGKAIKAETQKRTGRLSKQVGYCAKINRDTGQPELQIGYYSKAQAKKKGKQVSHANPAWAEFGVKSHTISIKKANTLSDGNINYGKSVSHPGLRGQSILRNSVFNNIDAIREAQAEYLAALNKTIEAAGGKIKESEEIEDV